MDPSLAAPPILGSLFLSTAQSHTLKRPPPLSSGSAAIDAATLQDGFRHGEITSIAGPKGLGKTLLTYHATCSHLLANLTGEIALIDTTGSFSPLRLRDVLVYRLHARAQWENLQRHTGYVYERSVAPDDDEGDGSVEEATRMLDRVKVMRVFDLAGVAEAVGEVGEMIEKTEAEIAAMMTLAEAGVPKPRSEIGDSEDEASTEDEDEPVPATGGDVQEAPQTTNVGKVGVIIIDSMTQVVSAIMNKSQTQGHALLTSFMRSLQLLTSRHHICTLLTNVAVGTESSKRRYSGPRGEDASIFASTMGRPALGRTFAHLIDTSIFLSLLPKEQDDAWIEYGEGREDETAQKVVVMEVLKDRCGARQGRWAAFEIKDGIKLAPYLT